MIQDQDTTVLNSDEIGIPTNTKPDAALEADLIFAMKVVKHVKSNAIVLVKDRQTVGIGPGQPNRITSAQIAIKNAGEKARGSILGSDAFSHLPIPLKRLQRQESQLSSNLADLFVIRSQSMLAINMASQC